MEKKRSHISVLFACCNVYNRIYINKAKTAYVGWCPKCCRKMTVKISKSGKNSRLFIARAC